MARQRGLIKLTGPIGDISFYKTAEDGYLARTKGGVDGDRIKNSPEFQRTRENGAEFGRAGLAAKILRQVFRELTVNASDSRMASRLTREMVKVVQADKTNARGQRNVIDGEAELLRGFEFNESAKLSRTFFAPYTVAIDRIGGSFEIGIPAFVPGNMIAYPAGATHCRLVAGGGDINFENSEYQVKTASTPEFILDNQQRAGTSLEILIAPGSTNPLFLVFGIEFYQQVNAQFYSLKNGAYNALSIIAVNGGV